MKSNSSAKKRFKKTASGEFKREKDNKRHILTKKTGRVALPKQPYKHLLFFEV